MISLQPQENYTIVRQLPDPSDSTTYYIQAVVRNSVTDAILKTVNLEDKGSCRFKANYQVPADVEGLGFYIDITTNVYTDSGYTTKSGSYADELEQYLVFDRIKPAMGGGGGGGSDVDYKKIQKMIDKIVKEIPPSVPTNFGPVMEQLQELKTAVSSIEIPEMEEIEFKPLLDAVASAEDRIVKAIDEKDVTPETDLTPVLDKIETKIQDTLDGLSSLGDKVEAVDAAITEYIDEYRTEQSAEEKMAKMTNAISEIMGSDIKSPKNMKKPLSERAKNLL